MAVLETKPDTEKHAIGVLETDLEVDFAPPVGYVEPSRQSGTSTPRSGTGLPAGGILHNQGTMAQSINYDSIAPSSSTAVAGSKAVSSNFLLGGQKLSSKKGSKAPTPKASTPVAGASTNSEPKTYARRTNGPQPLRLPPGMLFFGYEIKPVKKKDEEGQNVEVDETKPKFSGAGQTLRAGGKKKGEAVDSGVDKKETEKKGPPAGGPKPGGRTLRNTPR